MGVTSFGQRHALRHNRMDLALAEQLDKRAEILPEPGRIMRLAAGCPRPHSVPVAELLDLVWEHMPSRRQLVPEPEGRDGRVPVDHLWPVLVPVRERGVAAEDNKPAAGPQEAVGAKRNSATERVEDSVNTLASS